MKNKCSTTELIIYTTIVIIVIIFLIKFTTGGENYQGRITESMIEYARNYISTVLDKLRTSRSSLRIDELEKMRFKLADNSFILESNDDLIDEKINSDRLIKQLDMMIETKKMQQNRMIKNAKDYISTVLDKLRTSRSSLSIDELEEMRYKLGDNKFIFELNDDLIDYRKDSIRLMKQLDMMIETRKMQQNREMQDY